MPGGAPIGNKNAVGHGRPKDIPDEEVIQMGIDLLKWIDQVEKLPKEQYDQILHLSIFYRVEKDLCRSEWKTYIARCCFFPYYEKAMEWLANKLMMNKIIRESYGNRLLGMYLKDLNEFEREAKKFEYQLKKEISDTQHINWIHAIHELSERKHSERVAEQSPVATEQSIQDQNS